MDVVTRYDAAAPPAQCQETQAPAVELERVSVTQPLSFH